MDTLHRSLFAHQQKIAESMEDLHRMLCLIYEGYMKHKRSLLQEAENLGKKVRHFEATFNEEIVREGSREGARLLLSLPAHLSRAAECLDAVIQAVRAKIVDGTLFSDKAMDELSYVYTTVRDMTRDAKDVVLTRNPVLSEHVVSTNAKLSQAARDYMTAHEERLITGVCQPKHSSVFLQMMENLRSAGWHLREIVAKIQGGSAPHA